MAESSREPVYFMSEGSTITSASEDEACIPKMALYVGLAFFLVTLVTVIVLLTTGNESDVTTDEDHNDFKDDVPSGQSGKLNYVTRRKTTPAGTPRMLVCTFGKLGVLPAMVPPDGTCDVVFYEEVFYDHTNRRIRPTHSARAFHVLQALRDTYTMTTFGTSMATGAIAHSVGSDKAGVMGAVATLFNSGIVNFGMLNVADFENYDKYGSLTYLQVVHEFMKSKGDSAGHCALGISLSDGTLGKVILEMAKEATVDFPGITMVIIKLHAGKVARAADLWPVGPNPDGADLNQRKILTLSLGEDSLKDKLRDISDGKRWILLSFSMAVRTYRMKDNWRAPALDQAPLRAIEMDYAAVCKYNQEKTHADDVTNYSYDSGAKFLALFDDKETFQTKTQQRATLLPETYSGIAVYKVEADDFAGSCNTGTKFARLKAVREALK